MPAAAEASGGGGRRGAKEKDAGQALGSSKRRRDMDGFDTDLDRDVKEIVSLLRQMKGRSRKDGQKKSEQMIRSVTAEIQTMLQDTKSKIEKERQNFLQVLSKTSKECETSLKNEYTKFQATYDMFRKNKVAHVQNFKEVFSNFEDEKKKLLMQYEQHRKKEKAIASELDKTFSEKIAIAEKSMKKMKQDDKFFSILRKSIGSFLECGSDDDFGPEDD